MNPQAESMDVLSTFEAAQVLNTSPDNVRHLARTGRLRAVIVTRAGRLFSRRDVQELADARRLRAEREAATA